MGNSSEINFKESVNTEIQKTTELLHCLRMTSASRSLQFAHDVKRAEAALITVIEERLQDLSWEIFESTRCAKETRIERRRRAEGKRRDAALKRKWQRELKVKIAQGAKSSMVAVSTAAAAPKHFEPDGDGCSPTPFLEAHTPINDEQWFGSIEPGANP